MQHLKGFGLENFRVFKESTWFDFAPITILVGPNSSGKSSVTKALALLKNTFKPQNDGKLDFKTDENILQLGNFSRVLNKNSDSESIIFSLPFELNNFPTFGKSKEIRIEYEFKKTENSLDGKLNRCSLMYEGEIFINKSNETFTINTNIIRDNLFLNQDTVSIERESVLNEDGELVEGTNYMIVDCTIFAQESLDILSGTGLKPLYTNTKENNVHKIWDLYSSNKGGKIVSVSKEEFQKYVLESDDSNITIIDFALEKAGFSYIESQYIQKLFLNNFYKNPSLEIEYKHNFKIQPKRIYRREEEDSLNQLLNRYAEKPSKGENFLKKWCKEFKLLDELEYVLDIENNMQSIKVGLPLVEQGFGISQIITHLLRLVIFDEGIITFEEPEASLHPAFQSKLADMFADAQKTKNQQFIIETHSEYMVRRFQYLVAKGQMKKEDIVIYYFNGTKVKKIEIFGDGRLSSPFGTGFYDETARLLASLITGEYLN